MSEVPAIIPSGFPPLFCVGYTSMMENVKYSNEHGLNLHMINDFLTWARISNYEPVLGMNPYEWAVNVKSASPSFDINAPVSGQEPNFQLHHGVPIHDGYRMNLVFDLQIKRALSVMEVVGNILSHLKGIKYNQGEYIKALRPSRLCSYELIIGSPADLPLGSGVDLVHLKIDEINKVLSETKIFLDSRRNHFENITVCDEPGNIVIYYPEAGYYRPKLVRMERGHTLEQFMLRFIYEYYVNVTCDKSVVYIERFDWHETGYTFTLKMTDEPQSPATEN